MVLTLGAEVPSTPADGLVNTIWVPAIEDIQKPTAEEINAGTDLSNYVTLGGWSCSPSQDSISDQRENSAQDYENPGRKKISGSSIEVIDNTNTEHSAQNVAVETLAEGTEGYFVRRYGKQTDADFAAGDTVNVYAVRVGMSAKMAIAANSVLRSKVNFSVRAPGWAENVKVA
ncbi:phage tail tube protein [Bifidobacterium adolescentis]